VWKPFGAPQPRWAMDNNTITQRAWPRMRALQVEEAATSPKVGIALSGGGSRAIAFHLGCLRTLYAEGILQRSRILSTVSRGSVIGAMYSCHVGTFAEFEGLVRAVLRRGFVVPSLRAAFTTLQGPKAAAAFVMLAAAWAWLTPFRCIASVISGNYRARELWMPRRFASRTTILQHAIDTLVFRGKRLGDLPIDRPRLIAIATELRTQSAFYFGREHAGSWRFGGIDPAQIPVAHAVAASAAYPLFLPALDEFVTFRGRDGALQTERVTLSDGGVYDNLGLAPLWPDRDRAISIGVEEIDTIVACRAGYGLRTNEPSVFAKARMTAAFGAVHSRAQNATMKRLYDLKAAGRIRDFILPYLDQDDQRLAYPPPDLVRRISVDGYPTNFSAMTNEWIEKLSKRGEQLTLALLREHAPHLLSQSSCAEGPRSILSTPLPDTTPA
jgi:NTE family protein